MERVVARPTAEAVPARLALEAVVAVPPRLSEASPVARCTTRRLGSKHPPGCPRYASGTRRTLGETLQDWSRASHCPGSGSPDTRSVDRQLLPAGLVAFVKRVRPSSRYARPVPPFPTSATCPTLHKGADRFPSGRLDRQYRCRRTPSRTPLHLDLLRPVRQQSNRLSGS